jgi:hypothetical protein
MQQELRSMTMDPHQEQLKQLLVRADWGISVERDGQPKENLKKIG